VLKDKGGDKQWELPFAMATSEDCSDDDSACRERALQVDGRLTVIPVNHDSWP
jgi:hypothetical protein